MKEEEEKNGNRDVWRCWVDNFHNRLAHSLILTHPHFDMYDATYNHQNRDEK